MPRTSFSLGCGHISSDASPVSVEEMSAFSPQPAPSAACCRALSTVCSCFLSWCWDEPCSWCPLLKSQLEQLQMLSPDECSQPAFHCGQQPAWGDAYRLQLPQLQNYTWKHLASCISTSQAEVSHWKGTVLPLIFTDLPPSPNTLWPKSFQICIFLTANELLSC